MKRIMFTLFLLLALALAAPAQNTTVVGNSSYTNSLLVKATGLCKLYSLTVYNSGTSNQFVQIFNALSTPTNGTVAMFSYPVGATQFLSYDFSYYGCDIYPGCFVCISSTGDTLTLGGEHCGIQAIIKSN